MIDAPNLDGRVVTFIGPEGSGKTTLAKKLAHDIQKPYVSTGDLIRDLSQNDQGPLGEECRAMFREDTYLDPKTLLKILYDRYIRDDMASGFIVDGGLRTLPETEDYPDFLKKVGRDFPMTIVQLDIPRSLSLERTVTGSNPRKRSGETVEKVLKRLSKYDFQLDLRLAFIRQQPNWTLLLLDASGTIDETYQKLRAALNQ